MAQLYYTGNFPSCSRLYASVVACNTNRTPHYHVVDSGMRLNSLLEPEPEQAEIPFSCKRKFCELMMASNGQMGKEIQHLYWQCQNCIKNGAGSQVLEPEAAFCLTCSEDKLASAEAVVMSLAQTILTTWLNVQEEPAGNASFNVVNGRDLRKLAWSPHGRMNSGLLEMSWMDPRGQYAADNLGGLTLLYEPASCFCCPIHTDNYFYYWNGEYLDVSTDEPIGDLKEISISNNCDSNNLSGYYIAENEDYKINLNISDNIILNPTMSSSPNSIQNPNADEASGRSVAVLPIDPDRSVNEETMDEEDVMPPQPIGSKSLVSAKKGFTPFFKSIASRELLQQCNHPSCYTKSLTLMESYEATLLCRSIRLL